MIGFLQAQIGLAFQRICLTATAGFLFGFGLLTQNISDRRVKLLTRRRGRWGWFGLCLFRLCGRVSGGCVYLGGILIGLRHGGGDSAKPAAVLFVEGHEIGVMLEPSLAAVGTLHITPGQGHHLVRYFVLRIAIGTD